MNIQLVQSIKQMILTLSLEEQNWLKEQLEKKSSHYSPQVVDLNCFAGTIQVSQDPLSFQHQIRNEWTWLGNIDRR